MANGGTILLDEIGDMDLRLQAKLLQVLQDKEFLRLGSKEVSKVDVRVMAATHRDLQAASAQGLFREDLYYRLNVVDVLIPPLRDRLDEILRLAEYFLRVHATPNEPRLDLPPCIAPSVIGTSVAWEHPRTRERDAEVPGVEGCGCARQRPAASERETGVECRKTSRGRCCGAVDRSSRNCCGRFIDAARELRMARSSTAPDLSILNKVNSAHKAAEADAIIAALNACIWNRKQAAVLLNVDYKALLYKMKKLGIGEKKIAAMV